MFCPLFPAYLGFLWMLLLVAYGQRDPNSYYLNKHIEGSFTAGFQEVLSYQDFFKWARTTLVNNLYGPYPGTKIPVVVDDDDAVFKSKTGLGDNVL